MVELLDLQPIQVIQHCTFFYESMPCDLLVTISEVLQLVPSSHKKGMWLLKSMLHIRDIVATVVVPWYHLHRHCL
jgi:hypothetical protein